MRRPGALHPFMATLGSIIGAVMAILGAIFMVFATAVVFGLVAAAVVVGFRFGLYLMDGWVP